MDDENFAVCLGGGGEDEEREEGVTGRGQVPLGLQIDAIYLMLFLIIFHDYQ